MFKKDFGTQRGWMRSPPGGAGCGLLLLRRVVGSQLRFMSRPAYVGLKQPFNKVMACNRGEIAIRICRAATEL
jgi:hypothetical protein